MEATEGSLGVAEVKSGALEVHWGLVVWVGVGGGGWDGGVLSRWEQVEGRGCAGLHY